MLYTSYMAPEHHDEPPPSPLDALTETIVCCDSAGCWIDALTGKAGVGSDVDSAFAEQGRAVSRARYARCLSALKGLVASLPRSLEAEAAIKTERVRLRRVLEDMPRAGGRVAVSAVYAAIEAGAAPLTRQDEGQPVYWSGEAAAAPEKAPLPIKVGDRFRQRVDPVFTFAVWKVTPHDVLLRARRAEGRPSPNVSATFPLGWDWTQEWERLPPEGVALDDAPSSPRDTYTLTIDIAGGASVDELSAKLRGLEDAYAAAAHAAERFEVSRARLDAALEPRGMRVDVEAIEARHAFGPAAEDVAKLAGEAKRLWAALVKEAAERGGWAREASRLIGVVESGARLRDEFAAGARRANVEACAGVAQDAREEWERKGQTFEAAAALEIENAIRALTPGEPAPDRGRAAEERIKAELVALLASWDLRAPHITSYEVDLRAFIGKLGPQVVEGPVA